MAAPHVTFLRQNLTPAEQRLWQQLRARRSTPLRFRRQYPIGNYIVDFVCLAARLIVELDGETHNHTIAADERRTRWLERQGFRVIRFMNSDVMRYTEGVVQMIQSELLKHPPPTPSRSTASPSGKGVKKVRTHSPLLLGDREEKK